MHRIGRTGRAKRHGVAFTFTSMLTEEMRMDEIVRGTRNEVKPLKYENGMLVEVEPS